MTHCAKPSKSQLLKGVLTVIFVVSAFCYLGLTLFSAHWFSLLHDRFWQYAEGKKWMVISASVAICLTIGLILLIISISTSRVWVFLAICGVLMIAGIFMSIFLGYQVTDSEKSAAYSKMLQIYSTTNESQFTKRYSCTFNSSVVLSDDIGNCTLKIQEYIEDRFDGTRSWLLVYGYSMIASFTAFAAVSIVFWKC